MSLVIKIDYENKSCKSKTCEVCKDCSYCWYSRKLKDNIKGFVDKKKVLLRKNLEELETGLIVGGIIQEVSEKVNQGLKNKVTENLGTELPARGSTRKG